VNQGPWRNQQQFPKSLNPLTVTPAGASFRAGDGPRVLRRPADGGDGAPGQLQQRVRARAPADRAPGAEGERPGGALEPGEHRSRSRWVLYFLIKA
jgi:hypothetical protein